MCSRRLVTLVGPGGIGKTRLALESAERCRAAFADGVWLVELAALRSGADVPAAAAAALGLDDTDQLDTYVVHRRILLVLDNCEHVIEDAALLAARLLHAGSGVTVLATSRERLGMTGELLYPVEPLAPHEATELFLERAAAVGLALTGAQSDAVDTICAKLDRLPLALELAAARTRSLSLNDIAARVGNRLALLTGGDRTAPTAPRNSARCRRLEL